MRNNLRSFFLLVSLLIIFGCYKAPIEQPYRVNELNNLILQANRAFERGNLQSAELLYREAYKKARIIQDDNSSAIILISLSRLYSSLEQIKEAIRYIEAAEEILKRSALNKNIEEEIVFERARLSFISNENAEIFLRKLINSDSLSIRIKALNLFARLRLKEKNFEEAEKFIRESLLLNQNISRIEEANSWRILGELYLRKDISLSEKYLLKALEIDRELAVPEKIALDMEILGKFYRDIGNKQKALEYFKRTLEIWRELGNKELESKIIEEIKNL